MRSGVRACPHVLDIDLDLCAAMHVKTWGD